MKKLALAGVASMFMLLTSCDLFGPVDPIGPTVTTGIITDVQQSSFKITGTISDPQYKNSRQKKKSGRVTEYGFVYGTTDNPAAGTVRKVGDTIPSFPLDFGATISGLSANASYKVWAYAKNETGLLTYGNESGEQTLNVPKPSYTIGTHVTGAANNSGHVTQLNHNSLNNNPNAIVIVTANWQGGNQYNANAIGVWYSQPNWTIFNQNFASMPANVKYNLLITAPSDFAFKHVAASSNISGNTTILNHPSLNNKPNAKVLVTQRWNGTYNNSPVGVYYVDGRWAIFNQNLSDIKAGCEFNVVIDDDIFMTQAQSSSISGNFFPIAPSLTSSSASVFVTQYWTSVYNNQEIGVMWYSGRSWYVYNQNPSVNMPAAAKFFVLAK